VLVSLTGIAGLQAGLTALKCPLSFEEGCTKEDPLHLPEMKALAAGLPWAKHVTSKLVCSVTLGVMDDNNPPWVLPNGYVYSQRALDRLEREHGGKIVCPVTGIACLRESCVPAYIV
jgi:macrophage erythroblast attacher